MSVIKRLCLLVFGLSGIFCLGALMLPWFGPWTRGAATLLSEQWYYIAVEATFVVTALGVLVALVRAIFAPRNRKFVIVERVGSDQITVGSAAISSHARNIAEAGGAYVVERVWVSARKRSVRVALRVRPTHPVNVIEEGERLHDDLVAGLSTLVGDAIAGVELEFVESASPAAATGHAAVEDARLGAGDLAALADGVREGSGTVPAAGADQTASVQQAPGGITVSMSAVGADLAERAEARAGEGE